MWTSRRSCRPMGSCVQPAPFRFSGTEVRFVRYPSRTGGTTLFAPARFGWLFHRTVLGSLDVRDSRVPVGSVLICGVGPILDEALQCAWVR